MNYRKLLLFFVFFIALFIGIEANASTIDAPTILESKTIRDIDGIRNSYIKGLTVANTEVLVYLDGKFVDLANVSSENSETESFFYSFPNTVLIKGKSLAVVSRDKTSLVLSPPIEINLSIPELPAPTLISPDNNFISGHPRPFITGLSVSNTFVHVYIDGVYNGKTKVIRHESGTANFVYKPYLNLKVGSHFVALMAETKDGQTSKITDVFYFDIEEAMPAPILILPAENRTVSGDTVIAGLAKNNSKIKIFVDHKNIKVINVVNNLSGTANFKYKVENDLKRGSHLVYATAIDSRGKESIWSNIIYFTVKVPEITKSAESDNISSSCVKPDCVADKVLDDKPSDAKASDLACDVPDNKKGETEDKVDDSEVVVVDDGNSDEKVDINKEISDEDIKKLLEEDISTSTKESGLVNENNKLTSKLNWNLVVFIAFLLGVIAWIFWVNKELIKERNSKDDTE